MATVLQAMTLSQQQNKMYHSLQQHSPQNNCVIVNNVGPKSSVIHQGKVRPLAPAPSESRGSVLVNNNTDLRCKRKIQFMPYGQPPQQPASVARRNARERNRVKQVNNGFATLRQHIPASVATALSPQPPQSAGRGASKKLSKVETLRLAVEYIRSLQQMIDEHEGDMNTSVGSDNTTIDNRYYTNSSDMSQQYSSYPILLPTPSCSEASVSPTPSHSSEGSFSTASYTNNLYHHQENYENFEPKSPVKDDDELLDVIFLWQQNQ